MIGEQDNKKKKKKKFKLKMPKKPEKFFPNKK